MFIFNFSVSTDIIKSIKILAFYKRFSKSMILHTVPCMRGFNFFYFRLTYGICRSSSLSKLWQSGPLFKQAPCHESICMNGSTPAHIINLLTRQRQVVSYELQLLTQGHMLQYPINRWMSWGPEKNLLLGRILHPAHGPVKFIQFVGVTNFLCNKTPFVKTTLLTNSLILSKT